MIQNRFTRKSMIHGLLAAMIVAGVAIAADTYKFQATGDNYWHTAANWIKQGCSTSCEGPPTSCDDGIIVPAQTVNVDQTSTITNLRLNSASNIDLNDTLCVREKLVVYEASGVNVDVQIASTSNPLDAYILSAGAVRIFEKSSLELTDDDTRLKTPNQNCATCD